MVPDWALFTLESLGLLRTTTLAPEWQYAFTDELLQQALASTLTAPPVDQPARRAGTALWPVAASGMEGAVRRAGAVSPLDAEQAGAR